MFLSLPLKAGAVIRPLTLRAFGVDLHKCWGCLVKIGYSGTPFHYIYAPHVQVMLSSAASFLLAICCSNSRIFLVSSSVRASRSPVPTVSSLPKSQSSCIWRMIMRSSSDARIYGKVRTIAGNEPEKWEMTYHCLCCYFSLVRPCKASQACEIGCVPCTSA